MWLRLPPPEAAGSPQAARLSGPIVSRGGGALSLHRAGGRVLVQSEPSAEFPDMPRAAIQAGAADMVFPLSDLGRVIADIVAGTPRPKARSEIEAMESIFGENGEAAQRAREIDWEQTPLGGVLSWPPELRVIRPRAHAA